MKTRLIFYLAFAVMLAVSGCEEDEEPSQIPTVPTTFSIEDGAEITDTIITLSAGGSTVEDPRVSISYIYYIGKSVDALEKTSAEVTLEPYTQYFWCVQAHGDGNDFYESAIGGDGEVSEIRTFYCVPNLKLTSNNGDGEWAAIIHWGNTDKVKSVTVSATPDHEGYSLESQTIEGSVGFCKFNTTTPERDAYTHWWDDEHGVYYEPVIYTFNVEAKVQVGNKLCTTNGSIKEILLDNRYEVRDHEFNVYRLTKIGNQIWFADDFRAKTDFKGNALKYEVSTLESGAVGILYRSEDVNEKLPNIVPSGFHIATHEDWLELESYYGLTTDELTDDNVPLDTVGMELKYKEKLMSYFQGVEQSVGMFLESPYDWKQTNETNKDKDIMVVGFNAKPFGAYGYWYHFDDCKDRLCGQQVSAVYVTASCLGLYNIYRTIWAYSKGIMRSTQYSYGSVRLVKD